MSTGNLKQQQPRAEDTGRIYQLPRVTEPQDDHAVALDRAADGAKSILYQDLKTDVLAGHGSTHNPGATDEVPALVAHIPDIADHTNVPPMGGNANKFLAVNESEDGVVYKDAAGGALTNLVYKWNTTTGPNPGTGYISANSNTLSLVTTLYVSEIDRDGIDQTLRLMALRDKDSIAINSDNDADVINAQVVGSPVDSGSWITITVGSVQATGEFAFDENVSLSYVRYIPESHNEIAGRDAGDCHPQASVGGRGGSPDLQSDQIAQDAATQTVADDLTTHKAATNPHQVRHEQLPDTSTNGHPQGAIGGRTINSSTNLDNDQGKQDLATQQVAFSLTNHESNTDNPHSATHSQLPDTTSADSHPQTAISGRAANASADLQADQAAQDTATQAVATDLTNHEADQGNPHQVLHSDLSDLNTSGHPQGAILGREQINQSTDLYDDQWKQDINITAVTDDLADHVAAANPHSITHAALPDTAGSNSHPTSAITGLDTDQAAQDTATQAVATDLASHEADATNPHTVGHAQLTDTDTDGHPQTAIGGRAINSSTDLSHDQSIQDGDIEQVANDLASHEGDSNPHGITHMSLTDRSLADSHPTAAITGLDTKQADQDAATQAVATDLAGHEGDTANPHSVTHAQLPDTTLADSHPTSAITGLDTKQAAQDSATQAVATDLASHEGDTANPHSVTHAALPDTTSADSHPTSAITGLDTKQASQDTDILSNYNNLLAHVADIQTHNNVPDMTGSAGKFMAVNESGDGVIYKDQDPGSSTLLPYIYKDLAGALSGQIVNDTNDISTATVWQISKKDNGGVDSGTLLAALRAGDTVGISAINDNDYCEFELLADAGSFAEVVTLQVNMAKLVSVGDFDDSEEVGVSVVRYVPRSHNELAGRDSGDCHPQTAVGARTNTATGTPEETLHLQHDQTLQDSQISTNKSSIEDHVVRTDNPHSVTHASLADTNTDGHPQDAIGGRAATSSADLEADQVAQDTRIGNVETDLSTHEGDTANPHSVTHAALTDTNTDGHPQEAIEGRAVNSSTDLADDQAKQDAEIARAQNEVLEMTENRLLSAPYIFAGVATGDPGAGKWSRDGTWAYFYFSKLDRAGRERDIIIPDIEKGDWVWVSSTVGNVYVATQADYPLQDQGDYYLMTVDQSSLRQFGVFEEDMACQFEVYRKTSKDHSTLFNRSAADSHPTAAITGLDSKQASQDNATALVQTNLDSHEGAANPHGIVHASLTDTDTDGHPQIAIGGRTINSSTNLDNDQSKQDLATQQVAASLSNHQGASNPHDITHASLADTNTDGHPQTAIEGRVANSSTDLADDQSKQDTATATVQTNLNSHTGNTGNPHVVRHAQLSDKGSNTHAVIDAHLANTGNPHSVEHADLPDKGAKTHAQLDAHLATVTGNPHAVTHLNLPDRGTNTHAQIDTHLVTTGNPHSVEHADLPDKGSNTHAQIDSHVASTSNPHAVLHSQLSDRNNDQFAHLQYAQRQRALFDQGQGNIKTDTWYRLAECGEIGVVSASARGGKCELLFRMATYGGWWGTFRAVVQVNDVIASTDENLYQIHLSDIAFRSENSWPLSGRLWKVRLLKPNTAGDGWAFEFKLYPVAREEPNERAQVWMYQHERTSGTDAPWTAKFIESADTPPASHTAIEWELNDKTVETWITPEQAPVAEIRRDGIYGKNDKDLWDTMRWRGNWTQQDYRQNDCTRDNVWTMVANKDTSDRAGPQSEGDPEWVSNMPGTPPAFSIATSAATIATGVRFTFGASAVVSAYRWYCPDDTGNFEFEVWLSRNYGATEQLIAPQVGSSIGWKQINVNATVIQGTVMDLIVVAKAVNQPNTLVATWNVLNDNNPAPASGDAHFRNSATEITIHKTAVSGDASQLPNVTAGGTLSFAGLTWTVTSVTDVGDYMSFGVAPAQGRPSEAQREITITWGSATPVPYAYVTDHYSGFDSAEGFADTAYPPATTNANLYGADILADLLYGSPDWDVLALSGEHVTSGGAGVPSGTIRTYDVAMPSGGGTSIATTGFTSPMVLSSALVLDSGTAALIGYSAGDEIPLGEILMYEAGNIPHGDWDHAFQTVRRGGNVEILRASTFDTALVSRSTGITVQIPAADISNCSLRIAVVES